MRERRRLTDEERYLLRTGKAHLSSSFTAETPTEKAALVYANGLKKSTCILTLKYYEGMNKIYKMILED